MAQISAEQQARDLLERMEVEGAQSFSAGELVELADIVADAMAYRRLKAQAEMEFGDRSGPTTAPLNPGFNPGMMLRLQGGE